MHKTILPHVGVLLQPPYKFEGEYSGSCFTAAYPHQDDPKRGSLDLEAAEPDAVAEVRRLLDGKASQDRGPNEPMTALTLSSWLYACSF